MRRGIALWLASLAFLVAVDSDAQEATGLRDLSSFSGIADVKERSRAVFLEAAKVIMNQRCMNCHPADDTPTQGNDMHQHHPPVTRGADGGGIAGNTCQAYHGDRNYTLLEHASFQSMPGHPRWGLAPIEMAWQGKPIGEVCRQIKDPQRNGGRSLQLLHDHLAKDDLVGWAWSPGAGRIPVPGTQKKFGELIAAWIDSGAECP